MLKKYTCPMHPEVISDEQKPCPKCGMALTLAGQKRSVYDYMPLIVVIMMITASALIVSWHSQWPKDFIFAFMTAFFLVFSGFKLMDLKGFAKGYSTYDLLAGRFFAYGYIYPFIELSFGLLMLAGYHEDWLLWLEFSVMVFSGLGVFLKLLKHELFTCACLGTFLKVPLTYVTLLEDFGMAILALIAIFLT